MWEIKGELNNLNLTEFTLIEHRDVILATSIATRRDWSVNLDNACVSRHSDKSTGGRKHSQKCSVVSWGALNHTAIRNERIALEILPPCNKRQRLK